MELVGLLGMRLHDVGVWASGGRSLSSVVPCFRMYSPGRRPLAVSSLFGLGLNLDLVEFVADCNCVEFGVYIAQ